MSNKTKKLQSLIDEQEKILRSLNDEINSIDTDGILSENEKLKAEIEKTRAENAALRNSQKELSSELGNTKTALFTKMANEKLAAFRRVQNEIDETYYIENNKIDNRLKTYQKICHENINVMLKKINTYGNEEYSDIQVKLNELNKEIDERYKKIYLAHEEEKEKVTDANFKGEKKLKTEGLTETEKRLALKQKSLESFIGLNVLSKAGILLFIIGIIALGRFAYTKLPDLFKSAMIFALGAVLIGIGEYFFKKEKGVFSTALISGGVAVFYAAMATSYFAFHLFSAEVTFIVCIIITAIAMALSAQVKSQVVCALGSLGGYLPLIVTFMISAGNVAADKTFLPASAIYFSVLALIILIMTYSKEWFYAQYLGYAFQIIAIGGIAKYAWEFKNVFGYAYALPLAVGFAAVSFIIYMLMPGSKILRGKETTISDSLLLALNTISGAVSVSLTIHNCFYGKPFANRAVGAVFLLFTALYVLMLVISSKNKEKKSSIDITAILAIGSFIFSILIVPFLFGIEYVGIAWSVEGALIAIFAIKKENVIAEITGAITIPFALFVFLYYFLKDGNTFTALSITTITIVFLAFWAYLITALLSTPKNGIYVFLEILMEIATIGYLFYLFEAVLSLPSIIYSCQFTKSAIRIIIVLLVTIMMNAKLLKSVETDVFNAFLRFVSFVFTLIAINSTSSYSLITNFFGTEVSIKSFEVVNIILLVAINVFVLLLTTSSTSKMLNLFELPAWIYTAVLSGGGLLLITTCLMNQFGVKFSSVIISSIYLAVACILLFVGFKKRYTVVRSGGLVIILFAFAKLCFVDTHSLNTGWKIGAYFAFGAILIVISYFYQRFSKKLEKEITETVLKENTEKE